MSACPDKQPIAETAAMFVFVPRRKSSALEENANPRQRYSQDVDIAPLRREAICS